LANTSVFVFYYPTAETSSSSGMES